MVSKEAAAAGNYQTSRNANWIARGEFACAVILPKFEDVGVSVGELNSG